MKNILNQADEFSRRRFVTQAAKAFLGVSILPWAMPKQATAAGLGLNRPLNHAPKARNVIYLYMAGGMTHIDTFDPKPGTKTGGAYNRNQDQYRRIATCRKPSTSG